MLKYLQVLTKMYLCVCKFQHSLSYYQLQLTHFCMGLNMWSHTGHFVSGGRRSQLTMIIGKKKKIPLVIVHLEAFSWKISYWTIQKIFLWKIQNMYNTQKSTILLCPRQIKIRKTSTQLKTYAYHTLIIYNWTKPPSQINWVQLYFLFDKK